MGILLALAAVAFFVLGCWYGNGRERRLGEVLPVEPPQDRGNPELDAAEVEVREYRERVAGLEADLAKARAHIEPVAEDDLSAGTPPGVEEDPELGPVYPIRPEAADDLTAIRGVGKVVARQLNDLGVYTLAQIAAWDRARADVFAARMGFKDRLRRDDWVGQARRLGAGR